MPADQSRDHLGRKLRTLMHCALYRTTLKLSCRRCRHVALFDAVPVWWHFHRKGIDDAIPDVLNRFYCTHCWRDRKVVSRPRLEITRDMPRSSGLEYPDEREWKRIISRYRS